MIDWIVFYAVSALSQPYNGDVPNKRSIEDQNGKNWRPREDKHFHFLSLGNLLQTWGFHVVSLMFTLGNLEVSMWFPLCFPLETWGFHVDSTGFQVGNPGFLVVSLMFPFGYLGFP